MLEFFKFSLFSGLTFIIKNYETFQKTSKWTLRFPASIICGAFKGKYDFVNIFFGHRFGGQSYLLKTLINGTMNEGYEFRAAALMPAALDNLVSNFF